MRAQGQAWASPGLPLLPLQALAQAGPRRGPHISYLLFACLQREESMSAFWPHPGLKAPHPMPGSGPSRILSQAGTKGPQLKPGLGAISPTLGPWSQLTADCKLVALR